jgi:VIT1/CCC1 family predicted Fe2+/Mn2+ transporter
MRHREWHRTDRIGWLRAAVLGANDGIVSTASLVIGVAAAHWGQSEVLVAGIAGMTAGALSMAAGEYVSVSSQADTERADLARERGELAADPEAELRELTAIYVKRGLDATLAHTVAKQQWGAMHWRPTPEKSSASRRSLPRDRCRPRSLRRPRLPWARHSQSWR